MSCGCGGFGGNYFGGYYGNGIYNGSGYFAGYNACTGLEGGWNGGGYANWNLYGSPRTGFRGCQNSWFVGLGGDGNGIGF